MSDKIFTAKEGGYHSPGRQSTFQCIIKTTRDRLKIIRGLGVKFLVILGINRGGTTALQLLATQLAGVRFSEFQPFKDLLRNGAIRSTSFNYRAGDVCCGDAIVVKETLGPLQEVECTLDPVRFLLEAGVPAVDITAIFILRDPQRTHYSWAKFIDVQLGPFCLAQKSVVQIYHAYQGKLRCIPLCYEMLGQEAVLPRVFQLAGFGNEPRLDFDPDLLRRWMRWNEADSARGEEERYYWEKVVAPIISPGRFQYNSTAYPAPPPDVLTYLDREALPQYQEWQQLCDAFFA